MNEIFSGSAVCVRVKMMLHHYRGIASKDRETEGKCENEQKDCEWEDFLSQRHAKAPFNFRIRLAIRQIILNTCRVAKWGQHDSFSDSPLGNQTRKSVEWGGKVFPSFLHRNGKLFLVSCNAEFAGKGEILINKRSLDVVICLFLLLLPPSPSTSNCTKKNDQLENSLIQIFSLRRKIIDYEASN